MKFFDELAPAVHAELLEEIAAVGDRRMLAHPQLFRDLAARTPERQRQSDFDLAHRCGEQADRLWTRGGTSVQLRSEYRTSDADLSWPNALNL